MNKEQQADRFAIAFAALCENSLAECAAGVTGETMEFQILNDGVIAAEEGLPRWRRWWVEHRVIREIDYWPRMVDAEIARSAVLEARRQA